MKANYKLVFGLAAIGAIWSCSGDGAGSATGTGGKKLVEVQAFKGGYGIDFYEQAAKEWAAKKGDVEVKVEGDPRIWEKLKPRFIGGNPPDLTFPGWDMDHWALADEGLLEDLAPALKEKPYEGEGTWGDTFNPQLLALGQLDGKQFVLPYYVMLFGWWYDPGVFEKNGWTPPKTFDELLVLGEKMKAKGIAPLTYQGKYPYYMIDGFLLPWALSAGGPDAVKAAQNMEPGAWKSEAILKAASMIDELRQKGFFQSGALGLDHTASQMDFLNGKAAMVPCGSWLSSEMEKSMPPGVKVQYMTVPNVAGGKGDPTSLLIGIEPWMVPSAGKNKAEAIDLFKYMTSLPKAKEFVEKKGTLMAIKGSEQVKLPEVLVEPAKAFNNSKYVWAVQYRNWYKKFSTELEGSMASLLEGKITPQQFCDQVEAQAEKVRTDETIKKHKVN
ncbi:MAG: extracellular solute-binding protein [Chlorobia bacterium]|nr:extracellular solute-binding protein [Fimbriimonadaceae bacterium]